MILISNLIFEFNVGDNRKKIFLGWAPDELKTLATEEHSQWEA